MDTRATLTSSLCTLPHASHHALRKYTELRHLKHPSLEQRGKAARLSASVRVQGDGGSGVGRGAAAAAGETVAV